MQDKGSLRQELLAKRDAIPPVVKKAKERTIHERLQFLDEFRNAQTVLFFASFRSEVDTLGLIRLAFSQGKRVILPRVNRETRSLELFEIKDLGELVSGYMDIPEPPAREERAVSLNEVAIIVIPGAGFDTKGNRIGYGGGYYDRLLSALPEGIPLVAPAYEEQITDFVPSEPHDIKVHLIVTDRRVIRTGESVV